MDTVASMSAPLAGKFVDHYEILGVEPKATSETIQTAYARLAKMYHPNNKETGDKERFDAVCASYEILCDPTLRREFDKIKGIDQREGSPKFTGLPFFEALGRETALRSAMLCVLYDRRRTRPFTPSLSMRHLENILSATEEELNFALWYLKQRSLVASDDKSSLLITADGMDFLEEHRPEANLVMPLIKATGLASAAPEASNGSEAGEKNAAEPPLASLSKAIGFADRVLRESRQRQETMESLR